MLVYRFHSLQEINYGVYQRHLDLIGLFFSFQDHIFKLMKSDSYSRYLRSDLYKEFLSGTRKKVRLLSGIHGDWAIFKH